MNPYMRKAVSFWLITAFIGSSLYVPQARAGEMVMPLMPIPGTMVKLSSAFVPSHLKGITIHPDNALQFDFLIHKGEGGLDTDQKQEEYNKLIKYFLASLTIPDEDQWVNLSPYEKGRVVQTNFGKTEMGRDLLSQDYFLKQITSSLMYPESGLGKAFWDRVYARAAREFGNVNIPVNTFNKVWIVPDEAVVYESGNSAYILKSHLKVMLEEDYLSLDKHSVAATAGTDPKANAMHSVSSKVVREIILPELEKEVNEGKNFSMLRQIFSGMILAAWYKHALKESLLGKVYADQAKVKGVDQDPKANEEIYQKYLAAFKKGVYNYIKEDLDPATNQLIPRKYFAGGFQPIERVVDGRSNEVGVVQVFTRTTITGEDAAMLSETVANLVKGLIDRARILLRTSKEAEGPSKERVDTAAAQAHNVFSQWLKQNQKVLAAQPAAASITDLPYDQLPKDWKDFYTAIARDALTELLKAIQSPQARLQGTDLGDIQTAVDGDQSTMQANKLVSYVANKITTQIFIDKLKINDERDPRLSFAVLKAMFDSMRFASTFTPRASSDQAMAADQTGSGGPSAERMAELAKLMAGTRFQEIPAVKIEPGHVEGFKADMRELGRRLQEFQAQSAQYVDVWKEGQKDQDTEKAIAQTAADIDKYFQGLLNSDNPATKILAQTIKNVYQKYAQGQKIDRPLPNLPNALGLIKMSFGYPTAEKLASSINEGSGLNWFISFTQALGASEVSKERLDGWLKVALDVIGGAGGIVIPTVIYDNDALRSFAGMDNAMLVPVNGEADQYKPDAASAKTITDLAFYRMHSLDKRPGFTVNGRDEFIVGQISRLIKDTKNEEVLKSLPRDVSQYTGEAIIRALIANGVLDSAPEFETDAAMLARVEVSPKDKAGNPLAPAGMSIPDFKGFYELLKSEGYIDGELLVSQGQRTVFDTVDNYGKARHDTAKYGNFGIMRNDDVRIIREALNDLARDRRTASIEALYAALQAAQIRSLFREALQPRANAGETVDGAMISVPTQGEVNTLVGVLHQRFGAKLWPGLRDNEYKLAARNALILVQGAEDASSQQIEAVLGRAIAQAAEEKPLDETFGQDNHAETIVLLAGESLSRLLFSVNIAQNRELSFVNDLDSQKLYLNILKAAVDVLKSRVSVAQPGKVAGADAAQLAQAVKDTNVGGIDLNAANLNLQIKRDGKGVPLPLPQQDMQLLNRIEGFVPVIIEIKPVTTLPILTELQQKIPASQPGTLANAS